MSHNQALSHKLAVLKTKSSVAIKSKWFFPGLVSLLFITLVGFSINGSSVGIYHQFLYGKDSSDPALIYGKPQQVRSDEWLTWTQEVIMQGVSGYPVFNSLLGNDSDTTKDMVHPSFDWVTLFRPGSWGFFVLPFENGYSFMWWSMLYLLVISGYFFVLRILSKKYLAAALISGSFALSPFILWWYQPMLTMSLVYGFLLIILAQRIINKETIPKIKSKNVTGLLYIGTFGYLLSSLVLTLYPPYSVPIFIVVAAYIVGYFLNVHVKRLTIKNILLNLYPFVAGAIIALLVLLLYYVVHKDMIQATANTVYPGARHSPSGGLYFLSVLDGFLMPLVQSGVRTAGYYNNQSEVSNFILLLPFLLIPGIILQVIEYRKNHKVDWLLLCINVCALLFFARAFIKVDSFIYHLLLLDRVPNVRLRSGIGFLGIVQLPLLISKLRTLKLSSRQRNILASLTGLGTFLILLTVGSYVIHTYPNFLHNPLLMVVLAASISLIVFMLLTKRWLLGLVGFALFSIASSFHILPLYHGLAIIEDNDVIREIKSISSKDSRWVTTDSLFYINFPAVAGRHLVSGSQSYPDVKLWQQIDGDKYKNVWNRQARVVFISDQSMKEPMKLIQPNYFQVKLSCSKFLYNNVDYVLGVKKIDLPCLKEVKTVTYPNQTFYFYSIVDNRS